jgi:hypothetical protein
MGLERLMLRVSIIPVKLLLLLLCYVLVEMPGALIGSRRLFLVLSV